MKISLNWLKDYISFGISPEQLAHKLTMAGFEVEKIESVDGDKVFELEITPNRPDCLNFLGIAREISAILNKPLKLPKFEKVPAVKEKAQIEILDSQGCSRYIGIIIKGVSVQRSPKDVIQRLDAVGLRGINNVVDVTNYCLMETGQPLHAFDYDKLEGGRIIVRRAKEGEKIVTLDGMERELDSSILVIADSKKAVAIAGIMGGKETEVTSSTKNIFLESAYFDPIVIRRAARKIGISTDSSYRFERGVDLQMVEGASRRAISLIRKFAQGKIAASRDLLLNKKKIQNRHILFSSKDASDRLGDKIALSQCERILKKLEFSIKSDKKKNILTVIPPAFRNDVKEEVDVIEEIARVIGYDNLPSSLPAVLLTNMQSSPKREIKRKVVDSLLAQGCYEAITYTMIGSDFLKRTKISEDSALRVKNPLSQDQGFMRPSLLPGLLATVLLNQNRGQKDLKIFEAGKIYAASAEKEAIGVIIAGQQTADWRRQNKGSSDFYDIKGIIEQCLVSLGVSDVLFKEDDSRYLEKGEKAAIIVDSKVVGCLGKVSVDILNAWDIKLKDVYFAQLELQGMFSNLNLKRSFQSILQYPAVTRDISLAVKEEISFKKISELINGSQPENLSAIKFVEQYTGEKLPAGHRGITISLTYQSPSRTLREEEVAQAHGKVLQLLADRIGAIVR